MSRCWKDIAALGRASWNSLSLQAPCLRGWDRGACRPPARVQLYDSWECYRWIVIKHASCESFPVTKGWKSQMRVHVKWKTVSIFENWKIVGANIFWKLLKWENIFTRNVCGNHANLLKANGFGERSRLNEFPSFLPRFVDSGKGDKFKKIIIMTQFLKIIVKCFFLFRCFTSIWSSTQYCWQQPLGRGSHPSTKDSVGRKNIEHLTYYQWGNSLAGMACLLSALGSVGKNGSVWGFRPT